MVFDNRAQKPHRFSGVRRDGLSLQPKAGKQMRNCHIEPVVHSEIPPLIQTNYAPF